MPTVAFTVILEMPLRDEEVEPILSAIRQIRGVADVVPQVADPQVYWAESRARHKLLLEILAMLEKT